MSNPPPLHPVEQPAFRALMLLSFFLGVLLLLLDLLDGPRTTRFVSALTMLSFAVFLLALGLLLLAWMLREHELWREGRQDQED